MIYIQNNEEYKIIDLDCITVNEDIIYAHSKRGKCVSHKYNSADEAKNIYKAILQEIVNAKGNIIITLPNKYNTILKIQRSDN